MGPGRHQDRWLPLRPRRARRHLRRDDGAVHAHHRHGVLAGPRHLDRPRGAVRADHRDLRRDPLPVFVGLSARSRDKGIAVLGFALVYQQIENVTIEPRIRAAAVDVHPAVSFAAVLFGAALFGVAGAFVAVPVAGVDDADPVRHLHPHVRRAAPSRRRRRGAEGRRHRRHPALRPAGQPVVPAPAPPAPPARAQAGIRPTGLIRQHRRWC